jgi:hypothetical protein
MFELYIKYLLEGIAVAVAAYFIPRKKVEITEIIFIALSAAATFAVLDIFAPKVGDGARKGAGFGIGANVVGWPGAGLERFEDKKAKKDHKDHKDHKKHEESTDSSSVDSSKDMKSEDSSKDSSVAEKKEGFYADEKSADSSSTSSTKTSADEAKPQGGVAGFDNNKSYSQF